MLFLCTSFYIESKGDTQEPKSESRWKVMFVMNHAHTVMWLVCDSHTSFPTVWKVQTSQDFLKAMQLQHMRTNRLERHTWHSNTHSCIATYLLMPVYSKCKFITNRTDSRSTMRCQNLWQKLWGEGAMPTRCFISLRNLSNGTAVMIHV